MFDLTTIALLTLRSLSTVFMAAGETSKANTADKIAAGIEAGQNVDAEMADLAKAMGSSQVQDWDAAHANIESTLGRFLER